MLLDAATGKPVVPNGSMGFRYAESGTGRWNLDLEGVTPALSIRDVDDEVAEVLLPCFEAADAVVYLVRHSAKGSCSYLAVDAPFGTDQIVDALNAWQLVLSSLRAKSRQPHWAASERRMFEWHTRAQSSPQPVSSLLSCYARPT